MRLVAELVCVINATTVSRKTVESDVLSLIKILIPTLDHPTGADHALERLAAREGRVELTAVGQPAAILGSDQGALDHGFSVAGLQVFDDQFVSHVRVPCDDGFGWPARSVRRERAAGSAGSRRKPAHNSAGRWHRPCSSASFPPAPGRLATAHEWPEC